MTRDQQRAAVGAVRETTSCGHVLVLSRPMRARAMRAGASARATFVAHPRTAVVGLRRATAPPSIPAAGVKRASTELLGRVSDATRWDTVAGPSAGPGHFGPADVGLTIRRRT